MTIYTMINKIYNFSVRSLFSTNHNLFSSTINKIKKSLTNSNIKHFLPHLRFIFCLSLIIFFAFNKYQILLDTATFCELNNQKLLDELNEAQKQLEELETLQKTLASQIDCKTDLANETASKVKTASATSEGYEPKILGVILCALAVVIISNTIKCWH